MYYMQNCDCRPYLNGFIKHDVIIYYYYHYQIALTCLATPHLQYMLQITLHKKCLFSMIKGLNSKLIIK